MEVIELWRELENKIAASRRVLRITAVHGISGEDWRIAEILKPSTAVRAASVNSANPGHADARAKRQFGCSSLDDVSYDLVPRDEWLFPRR